MDGVKRGRKSEAAGRVGEELAQGFPYSGNIIVFNVFDLKIIIFKFIV